MIIQLKTDYEDHIMTHVDKSDKVRGVVQTKLVLVSIIVLVFIFVEFAGAYISNSVALYSDVIHLFSDLFGFACSLVAL